MKLLLLILLAGCATNPNTNKPEKPGIEFYRAYKTALSKCIVYVIDNPSNDVLRLAKADDVAIGKVMDGEILKCLDFNMELAYEE